MSILTSLSLEDLQRALILDLQAKDIQVTCINAESQEVNLVGADKKNRKAHVSVPYDSSYFPGLYQQALSALDIHMQRSLQTYPGPGPPPQRIYIPLTAADLLHYKTLLPPLSVAPTKFRDELERLVAIHNPTQRDLVRLVMEYSSSS